MATTFARSLAGLLLGAGLVVSAPAGAPLARGAELASAAPRSEPRRWTYLVDKLVTDGIARERVASVFDDPRFGSFDGLVFELRPREPRAAYRGFLRSSSVARARRCRDEYEHELTLAERRFGVPSSILTAILHIETDCGGNTGHNLILPRLARLAMANDPWNLEQNLERQAQHVSTPLDADTIREVKARAHYLESTFYPEVFATFLLAERLDIDPLEIRGSQSGAFGIPQFLPRSYLNYGVDANGNGRVSLFEPADAIASCANYLAAHGWKPGLQTSDRRHVLWTYNHSPAYIDTVLALAMRLDSRPTAQPPSTARKHRSRPAHGRTDLRSAKSSGHGSHAKAAPRN